AGMLTLPWEMLGTLHYMSPEQLSRNKVDARSDLYSLAVTLYEVLTLRPPYQGRSNHELERAILFEEPTSPRKLNPYLNRDLETVILHALEKNPEKRYPSAGEFAADLRRFLRYEPVKARPCSPLWKIARRALRHKGNVAAAAAMLVLVLLTSGLAIRSHRQERLQRIEGYAPKVLGAVMKMQRVRLATGVKSVDPGSPLADALRVIASESGRDPVEEAVEELREAQAALPDRPEA
ncbi:MAG: serine/threonine-protein kinase, partial [Candidatus Methylomirabilales bacterium]